MSTPTSILSQTLHSITTTKVAELHKQRSLYKAKKDAVLDATEQKGKDQQARVRALYAGVNELRQGIFFRHPTLVNIQSWIEQSVYDPTIPRETLDKFEQQLRNELEVEMTRFDFAGMYSRLLEEWLEMEDDKVNPLPMQETTILEDDESFELLEKERLLQLREKFEDVVFTPLETDEDEITKLLNNLFAGEAGQQALYNLRESVDQFAKVVLRRQPFDDETLKRTIRALMKNDLLNEEKKKVLQDFLQNSAVLAEIGNVLNMRWYDIENWSWGNEEGGIPVEPRRQLNGVYRVMMDEDVLQAIFLHHVGIVWSCAIKKMLRLCFQTEGIWKGGYSIPVKATERRQFYLGVDKEGPGINVKRQNTYWEDFFLSQLPNKEWDVTVDYDGDDEGESEDDIRRSWVELRQELLRVLTTEVRIQRAIHGKVGVVQTDLQWFATGLSHSALFTILRFLGFPETWMFFFRKFLEAPLNTQAHLQSPSTVLVRKRGVPIAHSLEKFFGELVLAFMDFAVNQHSGQLLYRLHDDIWVVGSPENCAKAWSTMISYAQVFGLEFNERKTGSVCITSAEQSPDAATVATLPTGPVSVDFLQLTASIEGALRLRINDEAVNTHILQLRKQLSDCGSIFSWIQTYNSCIGRFFTHTFGEPAACLGRAHVEDILETHRRMQDALFTDGETGSASAQLRNLMETRFGFRNVPDAFLFMPEELGGLGLKNPFTPLVLVKEHVKDNPEHFIKKTLEEVVRTYERHRSEFYNKSERKRRNEWWKQFADAEASASTGKRGSSTDESAPPDPDVFMSLDEFLRYRESLDVQLSHAYNALLTTPLKREVRLSQDVEEAFKHLPAGLQGATRLRDADAETKWSIMLHGDVLLEKFGGLSIVEKNLLPLGIMRMLREKKVKWQMSL